MAWQGAARCLGMALPTLEMLSEGWDAKPVVELGIEPCGIRVEVKMLCHAFTLTPLSTRRHELFAQLSAHAAAGKHVDLVSKRQGLSWDDVSEPESRVDAKRCVRV